jgi:hypothetical protein
MQRTGQHCCLIEVKDATAILRFSFQKHSRGMLREEPSASSMRKMSGAFSVSLPSASHFLSSTRIRGSKNIMRKPDHIFDLERRQQVLEEEIARALLHCSPDDPMVADIKRRILHLKEELERFCNKAIADRRLH